MHLFKLGHIFFTTTGILIINSLISHTKSLKQTNMENSVVHPPTQRPRYALVTGANKGIGFEICRQLASKGVVVILGSRDENRGIEAQQRLKEDFDKLVVFHQLDVVDPASVAAAVEFIKTKFGKLDILVNNAGILGVYVDGDDSLLHEYLEGEIASFSAGGQLTKSFHPKANGRLMETFEGAKECIDTNYYGVKTITQAFIPLLQQSDSPTIVNVSSTAGAFKLLPEWANGVLSSEDNGLTEERADQVVQEFLKHFKEGSLEQNQWPPRFAAYKVSKAALNAHTRLIAKEHPSFRINAVCPGYARTDITYNSGVFSAAEGAEAPVKLALLPRGGPSGSFFYRAEALAL